MLHARLREVRKSKGLTLQEVAERITPPTTAQTIGRLETGMRNLTMDWLQKIAAGLDVDPAELLALPQGGDIVVSGTVQADGKVGEGNSEVITLRLDAQSPEAVKLDVDSGPYRRGDVVVCDRALKVPIGQAQDALVTCSDGERLFGKVVHRDQEHILVGLSSQGGLIELGPDCDIAPAITLIRRLGEAERGN